MRSTADGVAVTVRGTSQLSWFRLKVDVIVTQGLTVFDTKAETHSIPVVFGFSGDHVEAKLVTSIARPGGNLTGITFSVAGAGGQVSLSSSLRKGRRFHGNRKRQGGWKTSALPRDRYRRTMTEEFTGSGWLMTAEGLSEEADRMRVKVAEIWAVLTVETRGCGFLPDRRPQILFERHVFHRETSGAYHALAPGVSSTVPGSYGSGGAHQYERLGRALQLDRLAALRSTSWGLAS
jgi:hypothetical protein